MKHQVMFLPDNIKVTVAEGTSVLDAARLAGIGIKSNCGGDGSCRRCRLLLAHGDKEQLACQTVINEDLEVFVPEGSRLKEHRVLLDRVDGEETLKALSAGYPFLPLSRKVELQLPPPTLAENTADLSRLLMVLRRELAAELKNREVGIAYPALQKLAHSLRESWRVTLTLSFNGTDYEIIDVERGSSHSPALGLAVDIGTTTVSVYLLNLETGTVLARKGMYNRQSRYGDDIISRIIHATEEKQGLINLHRAVLETVNLLIEKTTRQAGVSADSISQIVVAGNTTMTHLFWGITPKFIRLEPYIPTFTDVPPLKAAALSLKAHPEAFVLSFPQVASYVGGDIVSGALFTRLAKREEIVLFIDIGTNGEMVLGNKDWMAACACSAGPAFEGGGITWGMRAMNGAIERVIIDPQTLHVQVKTINNTKAVGICGSGLIDCLSKLHRAGIIDRTGKFQRKEPSSRLRRGEEGWEFVLVAKEETASGRDLVITEGDIKNLIRAKGAVFAGIRTLLRMVELGEEVIDEIIIAGGFGNYLNIRDAVRIGLLPDLPPDKFRFVGNSSVKGACTALLSRIAYEEGRSLGSRMTYLELSADNTFMDEFISALFLPHTDLELFPSVRD